MTTASDGGSTAAGGAQAGAATGADAMSLDGADGGTDVDVTAVGETMGCFLLRDHADECGVTFIGAESNLAIGLASLGHRVRWASRLGDDHLGEQIRHGLQSRGVDVHAPRDPDRHTGVAIKELGSDGATVRYYRKDSAASAMTAEDVPAIAGSRWLHITGITPALSVECAQLISDLIADARSNDVKISLDANLRPVLWKHLDDAAAAMRVLCGAADLTFIGEDESRALGFGATAAEFLDNIDVPSGALVCFKLGARGAEAAVDGATYTSQAIESEVVDVTGAGDAFAAGFLSGTLRDLTVPQRLHLGHLMASRVIGVDTDFVEPFDDEVRNALLDAVTDVTATP